ncbi:uncharacterized protein [Asterias amurensis]|uniref:uncharacterized protein n=1 Tax=Asterias amurensis TaxID=7602 RepID=UPI003AB65D9A
MPIARVSDAQRTIRKLVPFRGDHDEFVDLVKTKFQIDKDQDVYFVDDKDGAGIDADVINDVLQSDQGITMMVLKEGEEWGSL